jgi:very-short-patch-repair endonuclease
LRGLRFIETHRARLLRRDAPTAERILWRALRNRSLGGFKFVRQEPIGPYFADFACREAKLAIEIDGATHSTPEEIAHDARRTVFLEDRGYRALRFTNGQIFENLEAVAADILAALGESA